MNKIRSFLSRRKFGAVGLVGGGSFVMAGLTACSEGEKVHTINVTVDEYSCNGPSVVPINEVVPKDTTKLRFVSASPGWIFLQTDDTGYLGAAPRIWRDGENPSGTVGPIENGMACETQKIPSDGITVNVYVVMGPAGVHPQSPGNCGGGGNISAEH